MTDKKKAILALIEDYDLTLKECIDIFSDYGRAQAAEFSRASFIDRLRSFLRELDHGEIIDTRGLIDAILTNPEKSSQIKRKAAFYCMDFARDHPKLASHDGEQKQRYGRTVVGWRWHGQKEEDKNE